NATGRAGSAVCRSADVEREEVVLGLAADQGADLAVAHGDHRRPGHVVVVGGQRVAVGPGHGHRDQVAALHVGGEVLVLDHDVAALAVLADHAHHLGRGVGDPAGEQAGVVGVVQRGAHVVAHPAVDGDVDAVVGTAQAHVLDRAHGVQGLGRGSG